MQTSGQRLEFKFPHIRHSYSFQLELWTGVKRTRVYVEHFQSAEHSQLLRSHIRTPMDDLLLIEEKIDVEVRSLDTRVFDHKTFADVLNSLIRSNFSSSILYGDTSTCSRGIQGSNHWFRLADETLTAAPVSSIPTEYRGPDFSVHLQLESDASSYLSFCSFAPVIAQIIRLISFLPADWQCWQLTAWLPVLYIKKNDFQFTIWQHVINSKVDVACVDFQIKRVRMKPNPPTICFALSSVHSAGF